jgi:hypothetical protein
MPGYHNRKKKLYKMGGEMDSYKKGGKMPSWLLKMFKEKAEKSMEHGGELHGDEKKEKRFGTVERIDDTGRPYEVKKGLFNEKEFYVHEDGRRSPLLKNRTKLGKMLLGSDAKLTLGTGGKMYSFEHGGKHPEGDDIPMLDPNADFLTKDRYVEEPGIGFQDGFFIEGDGPIIKGLTLGSETLQSVGGEKPQLATMYLTGGEGKMQKKIEKMPPSKTPPKDIPPVPPRPPKEIPQDQTKKIIPPPPARTPSEGMTYANVGSYFNPGGERVYRRRGDGQVTAVGMKEFEDQDRIPTGLRTKDGERKFATREVYQMMQDEGVDPYSPEAAMFMEDVYKSNPELFGDNYNESEVMIHRMLHADKGITQAGREGKDEGYFFPDQLFGRMTPEQRRQQDLANVRAANAARKEAEAERKRKAEERRQQDIAKMRSRRMAGGGKLYHFGG